MTGRRKITDEQAARMIELYQNGASIADVSNVMNISPSTVASNLGKRIKLRAPGHRRAYFIDDTGDTKTGKGRNTRGICGVREVEEVPCPAREAGPHELVNDTRARTACAHCRRSWTDLDAEQRRTP